MRSEPESKITLTPYLSTAPRLFVSFLHLLSIDRLPDRVVGSDRECCRRRSILFGLIGSFSDDIENLRRLSGRITRTLNQMFRSVRVGIGSFVDVGGYCFHSESIMSQMSEYELQATIGSLNISRQSNICRGSQTPSLVNITQGEASLTALYEVGRKHEALGFTGRANNSMRVVLMVSGR